MNATQVVHLTKSESTMDARRKQASPAETSERSCSTQCSSASILVVGRESSRVTRACGARYSARGIAVGRSVRHRMAALAASRKPVWMPSKFRATCRRDGERLAYVFGLVRPRTR
jgi:hypothetical protein